MGHESQQAMSHSLALGLVGWCQPLATAALSAGCSQGSQGEVGSPGAVGMREGGPEDWRRLASDLTWSAGGAPGCYPLFSMPP